MKTKSINQHITFKSSPAEIYELLMDSKKHSTFTGGAATMSRKPKGKFSVYDGYCHGYNMELTPGKKIVQAWHFAEEGWPDDHFSVCTFKLLKSRTGTQLLFKQTGVPEHKYDALKEGWKEYYWNAIRKYLTGKKIK